MFRLKFLLLSTISFNIAIAQKPVYSHQQSFNVEDGLPQSFVSSIIQDDAGFIWISTLDGLARYDGRNFVVFPQQNEDSLNLSSNVIYWMLKSKGNLFWLFYQGSQIDRFNPNTNKIIKKTSWQQTGFSEPFSNTYEDTGKFWTFRLKRGVVWSDPVTGEKSYANIDNGLLRDENIIATTTLPGDRLVLLSQRSVQISDSSRKHFSYFPLQQTLPIGDPVQMLHVGKKLVAAAPDGLWLIDYEKGSFTHIPIDFHSFTPSANTLRKGPDGRLYIRGEYCVYRLEANDSLTLIWQNNVAPGRKLNCILIDRTDVLWVGLDVGGLVRVNLRAMPLKSYQYETSFHVDVLSKLGIPTSQMPSSWKVNNGAYNFRFDYGPDSTLYFSCDGTAIDAAGIFTYKNKQLRALRFPPDSTTAIRGIVTGKEGGLSVLDYLTLGIWHWKNEQSLPVKTVVSNFPNRATQIADLAIINDTAWVTTYGRGLYKIKNGDILDHIDKQSKSNSIPYDLSNILQDPHNPNLIWIGSLGGGLILWDNKTGLKRIFTTEDGLPNNTIYCIVPDRLGKLWMSSNKGIFRFDPVTYEVLVIEKNDGLPGNEFNRSHKFVFPDGRIAFGGIDGYVIFDPADFKQQHDTIPPPIVLTEILINNYVQRPGSKNSLISTPLNLLNKLILPYNKNYITVSFAALQFNEPQKIRYRYRLRGLNKEWTEIGNNNTAYYTNLRPGDYVLEINATDINGNWSSSSRELSIIILPPLWLTWWAYCIYAIAAISSVVGYFRYRERRLKTQQQLLYEHREAARLRELDEVKTRFFSNITHEFRTPLTLIITPLEKIHKQGVLPAPELQTIDTAKRNAEKLLRLINELMDLSKLEAGQMKVVHSTGELAVFVTEFMQSFREGADEKKIRLSLSTDGVNGFYQFDEEKWEKIIGNLLGNALKFTPSHGEVGVTLQRVSANGSAQHLIRLAVEDSGPGIVKEQLTQIFDRFFQADLATTRKYEGTGIGLSLVKELTRLMNGTVRAENMENGGARFVVEIPVSPVVMSITEKIEPGAKEYLHEPSASKELPLILIAEDNSELRTFLTDSLSHKWRIVQSTDGIDAWDKILKEMPDLVISDLMMPGRDGVELCNLCKNDNRTSHIGFILLTARSSHSSKLEGLGTGADAYITKPFHLGELELQIANLLRLHEKLRTHLESRLLPALPQAEPPIVENPFIARLYTLLEEKLDDPQLNVEWLAAATNMSRSSLNRKLKSLMNVSANELIRRYRLQKAAALLSSGADITSTAYKTGFSSPSYFAQCFREEYNQTPSEWISRSL